MENGRHPIRPLQVPHYTVRAVQLTLCIPGIHEQGLPVIPPLFQHRLYRQNPHLLLEPGQPLPPRDAGPSETLRIPSVPEAQV